MKKELNNKPNAWEPALWAMLCGASTVSTTGTICDTSVTPEWLRAALIMITASVTVGSAYKMYHSIKKQNEYMQYLQNRQRKR